MSDTTLPTTASPLMKPALIFLGAGVGGLARYWFGTWIQTLTGPAFPYGTLAVNVTGCVAMGFIAALLAAEGTQREELRAALLIGVLGGYTTFSSFGRETIALAAEGRWVAAGAYVLLSNLLCLVGVWAGATVAKAFGAPSA